MQQNSREPLHLIKKRNSRCAMRFLNLSNRWKNRGYFGYLNLDDRNTQQQNYFTNNRSSFSGNLQSDVNLTAQVSNVSDQQVNPGYSSSELVFGNIAPIHQQQIVDPPVEDSREVATGFSISTTNNNYYRNMITSSQLLFGSNVRATNLAAANTHQVSVEQAPLLNARAK